MTKSDGLHLRPTDDLLQLTKTNFYPLNIPVPHHQLRHFISTVEQDWIYYAENHDIYSVHIPSQRRILLVTIPFIPRCLSARLGWICVGGESHGDVAFVRVGDADVEGRPQVEAALPVGRPTPSKRPPPPRPGDAGYGTSACPEMIVQELGGDIVNAVTVHELANKGTSGRNESVVVISNNDMTVKIYSLSQRKLIADLIHPVQMNYALMSPDSEILVAVGDGDQAFFYRREQINVKASEVNNKNPYRRYEWQLFATPKIPLGEPLVDDHSFSITFSSFSDLCAISSQGGVITVFDVKALRTCSRDDTSEKAIFCFFNSSRSGVVGCVRSMAFSPAPWDLLAWAEDHGRAGVADVRQAFCRRQFVKLETHALGLGRIKIEDVTHSTIKSLDTKGRLIHQYRQRMQFDESIANEPILGRPMSWSEEGLPTRQNRGSGLSYHTGLDLDERETSILNTLEVTMDEIYEASTSPSSRPYSVNYRSTPRARTALDTEESTAPSTPLGHGRNRSRDRSYLPRRQSSVILSQSSNVAPALSNLAPLGSSRSRFTASPARIPHAENESDADLPPLITTNDLTPTSRGSDSQPLPYDIPPSDPWHVIQRAFDPERTNNSAAQPNRSDSAPHLSRYETSSAAERQVSLLSSVTQPSGTNSAFGQTSAPPLAARSDHQQLPNLRVDFRNPREVLLPLSSEADAERQIGHSSADLRSRDPGESATASLSHILDDDRHQRILEARAQARQRVAAANANTNASSTRPNVQRRTELSGRVTHADIHLARLMMMSSSRNMIDRNGNWVAVEALDRLLGGRGASGVADAQRLPAMADVAREVGVGTAGIGWSPDGRNLYVGTTEGIFEYTINLTDRKTFPALAFQ